MRGSTHPGALESGADDGEALGIGECEPISRVRLYKIAHNARFLQSGRWAWKEASNLEGPFYRPATEGERDGALESPTDDDYGRPWSYFMHRTLADALEMMTAAA
jgi:hypothetical protein